MACSRRKPRPPLFRKGRKSVLVKLGEIHQSARCHSFSPLGEKARMRGVTSGVRLYLAIHVPIPNLRPSATRK